MLNLTSPKVIKDIIEEHGFKFSKSLGQNFLIDANITRKIVEFAEITDKECVLEIGPGIGTLTQLLCQRAKKVIAIEIDSKLVPILKSNLKEYNNLKIINNDVLKIDLRELVEKEFDNSKIKVIGNLPYYITTPIILELLGKKLNISDITIMVQKEVAQRINAKPGTKHYGALSIAVQYYCKPKIGFTVSNMCFMPSPKVNSIVLKLELLDKPMVEVRNEKVFFKTVKAAFSQRRKTLLNSLSSSNLLNINKQQIRNILSKLGIPENQRGENLTLEQFAKLSDELTEHVK